MLKVAIIGAGGIAKRLHRRLVDRKCEVLYFLRRDTYMQEGVERSRNGRTLARMFDSGPELIPETMFIAIPTLDRGERARDYIVDCINAGVRVVTCEKGSLAFHAEELQPYWDGRLKYTAAVGGGTQILRFLRSRHLNERQAEINAVINGTCNFIFDEVARGGRTLGEACQEAGRLGYAEPGANDPLSLINGELRDVMMKTCVLFNTTLARDEFITPDVLTEFQLSSGQLEELNGQAGNYRLVVSFSNRQSARSYPYLNKFECSVDGWHIQGGFRKTTSDTDLLSWLPAGVGNAIHVVEGNLGSGGKYTLTGPGAGHEPTTTAMLNDLMGE